MFIVSRSSSSSSMSPAALPMASISSVRSCCFSAKDIFFSSHSMVMSLSVFSFSAYLSIYISMYISMYISLYIHIYIYIYHSSRSRPSCRWWRRAASCSRPSSRSCAPLSKGIVAWLLMHPQNPSFRNKRMNQKLTAHEPLKNHVYLLLKSKDVSVMALIPLTLWH